MHDQRPSDELSLDNLNDSSVAMLDPEAAVNTRAAEWTGPRCEKCDEPLKSEAVTICRQCGWYASLGTFVEVDPNWESDTDDQRSSDPVPQKSHVQVWLGLLPRWSWVIIGSVLAVVAESVIARFATPADGALRTTWSLSQLAAGFVVVAGCHIFNFLVCAADDADFGVLDLFLKPLKLWIRAAHNLPHRLWVTNSAACGLAAMVLSLAVIGGIPYERLWDWGFQAPVKQNLMGAVMDRAKQLDSRNGADNLEDAIGDFAGSQGIEGEETKMPPPKPRSQADCVIIGYQVDRDGRLATLFLGTAHRKKLIYAGRVTPDLPDEELQSLLESLEAAQRKGAFIPMQLKANWVEPKFACRVTYGERLKSGQLRDIQWDTLMGGIRTQSQ
jgi:hypothetical protein